MFELPKSERLCSRSKIEELFMRKEKIRSGALMASFVLDPSLTSTQVLFSVPKKRFRKAVDRNRIKRLMRDVYRHQKTRLPHIGSLAVIYTGRECPDHTQMQSQMTKLILKLCAAS